MAFFNLQIVAVNGFTNTDSSTVSILENVDTNRVLGKITGFDPLEDSSKLVFTPDTTTTTNQGDDFGRYGIMRALTDGPGATPEWRTGDWIVYVKAGGKTNFNYEDTNGPSNNWQNVIQYNVSGQSGYTLKSTYGVNFAFAMQNVNEAPTSLTINNGAGAGTSITMQETKQSGAVIGVLASTDEDRTAATGGPTTHVYTFSNGQTIDPSGRFEILKNTGVTPNRWEIKLVPGADLDYDSLPAGAKFVELDVVVRDMNGGASSQSLPQKFRINLTNDASDDPVAAAPVVQFSSANPTVMLAEGTSASGFTDYTFTLSRSGDLSQPSTVTWTLNGTGLTSGDVEAMSGIASFAADAPTATFTVKVRQDVEVELSETYTVTLSAAGSGNATVSGNTTGTLVVNNDDLPTLSISADAASVTEGQSGTKTYTFTVTRDSDVGTSSANWAVKHLLTSANDFAAGTPLNGTVTFQNGQRTQTITLTVAGDTGEERDETFSVELSNPANAVISGAGGTANGTITNDDFPTLSISGPASITEGSSGTKTYTFNVTRTSSFMESTVEWTLEHGSTNGSDFTGATSGTIRFFPNETAGQITLTVEGDTAVEPDETFTIVLSNPTNAVIVGTGRANGTITNDDTQANNAPVITGVVAAGKGSAGTTGTDVGRFLIDENEGAGVVVDMNASDGDGDTLTYTLVGANGTYNGLFSIDAAGQIAITNPALLNLNADADYNLTVQVSDNKGGSVNHLVFIRVKNVNQIPVIDGVAASGSGTAGSGAQANKILVSEAAGAAEIAAVTAHDNDGGTITYALDNTHNGLFSIDAAGKIRVANASNLPVNVDTDYLLTVRISDGQGGQATRDVVVRVTNQNQNPTLPTLTASGEGVAGTGADAGKILLSEKVNSNTELGTLSATDLDGGTITYELDPQHNGGGLFTVDGNKIKVTNANLLPVNSDTPYTIKVIVRDGQGGSSTRDFTIIVQDKDVINTPPGTPTLDNATTLTVNENTPFAGTLRATDNETTAGMTFEFDTTEVGGGDASDMFVIDGNQLKLAPGKVLDYEAISGAKSYTVYVKAKDGSGALGETQAITINVADVNENPPANKAPTDISYSGVTSFAEMPLNGTTLGTLGATDPNDAGGFVYSIVNPDGRFQIVGNELKIANGSLFDFETRSAHAVTVRVTDKNGTGLSYDETFTFGVTDGVDIWMGTNGNNTLRGTAGPDKLYGLKGKDKLYGGTGDDVISGGEGNDTLYGQKGKNAFVFDAKLGTASSDRKVNFDAIKDFVVKDDSIWLDDKIFKASALKKLGKTASEVNPKQLTKKFFTIGEEAKDKDDYIIYNKTTGVLSYDADGSGSKAAIEIAQLKKNLKMSFKDFFII